MHNKIIEFKNISAGYENKIILKNICLDIYEKDFIGILGPNGAGKTTLIKTLVNICKPQTGDIFLYEKNLKDISQKKLVQEIAFIPQNLSITFGVTVNDFVSFARFPYKNNFFNLNDKDLEIIDNAMKITDVYKFKNKFINELSQGEFQRVLIAQGLAQNPKVLIIDEPSAHLDIKYQRKILDILKELNNCGMTIVIILHDINLANKYCSREIFIKDGKIIADGIPEHVCNKEILYEVYEIDLQINREINSKFIHIY
jgi:iron complex transport system ATP-binding protein